MSLKKASLLILLILLIDQVSKIYIKTHFMLGQEIDVLGWFRILFVENDGMAWGAKIPGSYGKIILTSFRIVAVSLISYWLWDTIRKKSPRILIISVSLILAGAFGNIIDSVFYGVIFDSSLGQIATLFADEPYGELLKGKVVDMLYFPMYSDILPNWVPLWGGEYFVFFAPVFNIADTAISTGFGLLVVFNKKAFPKDK
ncbi:lipoprotein signal peptidase LspA [Psychroflexus torquis ATCC 700755]|uniref:Lipoprotein signal peptidase n=1 Tax=Psychroflexus torquis (strain ATCC 700755 / CIP 106069 / ACAM 623) TaxID=313595 RepID=K4IF02_PSYTT|nr:lipoprotein signal peptidase [Psychroflexus torquis]AFU69122.1 lipoprotein signal peptidase LspA [Psychroflexus torquis ATCC 700755]